MRTFLEKWYQERKRKANDRLYNKGYDYTAGVLLRGEETPLSLPTYVSPEYWSFFYYGCDDAIDRLVDAGVIEDDRIKEEM